MIGLNIPHARINMRRKQSGLSLIELMVTMVVGLILILGVSEIFLNSNRSNITSNELARVQENGRIALELIAREVRRAGYQGCVAASTTTKSGGITYPADAISGDAGSLTLNYVRLDSAGNFPNRDCDNNKMGAFQVTIANCGNNLCITSTETGGKQQLTTNTKMAVRYGVQQGNNIVWSALDNTSKPALWTAVNTVDVELTVTSPKGEATRTFNSTIGLRNRL